MMSTEPQKGRRGKRNQNDSLDQQSKTIQSIQYNDCLDSEPIIQSRNVQQPMKKTMKTVIDRNKYSNARKFKQASIGTSTAYQDPGRQQDQSQNMFPYSVGNKLIYNEVQNVQQRSFSTQSPFLQKGMVLAPSADNQMRNTKSFAVQSQKHQSSTTDNTQLIKAGKRKTRTLVSIDQSHQKRDSTSTYEGQEKLEKNIKLIDQMLNSDGSQPYQIKQYPTNYHSQIRQSLHRIKEADVMQQSIHQIRKSSQNLDLDFDDEQIIKQHRYDPQSQLIRQSQVYSSGGIPLTNLSIVHQAELLYGKGRRDAMAYSSMDTQMPKSNDLTQLDKVNTLQSTQVKNLEYKGMKGSKKIAKNERKKRDSQDEDEDVSRIAKKDSKSDLEIVLQLQRQRPQSQYLRKKVITGQSMPRQDSHQYIQQLIDNENKGYSLNKQLNRDKSFTSRGLRSHKSQQSLRQDSNKKKAQGTQSSAYYQNVHYKGKESETITQSISQSGPAEYMTVESKGPSTEPDGPAYNNIVIKINNLNTQHQPQFSIVGNNNFTKIYVNPVFVNQSISLANTKMLKTKEKPQRLMQERAQQRQLQAKRQVNLKITKTQFQNAEGSDKVPPDGRNLNQSETNHSFFQNSDLQSVHSSIFQDKTITPQTLQLSKNNLTSNQQTLSNKRPNLNYTPIERQTMGYQRQLNESVQSQKRTAYSQLGFQTGQNAGRKLEGSFKDKWSLGQQQKNSSYQNQQSLSKPKSRVDKPQENREYIKILQQQQSNSTEYFNKQYSAFNISYSKPSDYNNFNLNQQRQMQQQDLHNIITQQMVENRKVNNVTQLIQEFSTHISPERNNGMNYQSKSQQNQNYQTSAVQKSSSTGFDNLVVGESSSFLNEVDMLRLLSKRNYIKLQRSVYQDGEAAYNNRSYLSSLEIKERVAASNLSRQKSRESLRKTGFGSESKPSHQNSTEVKYLN